MLLKKLKNLSFLCGIFSLLAFLPTKTMETKEKHIVVVTASYNNKKWYKKNLDSVFNQNYKNWSLIYIDDCSTDETGDLVERYVEEQGFQNNVTIIKNEKRVASPLANQYKAIYSCKDDDIIIILDGDDFFAHPNVLTYINKIYADPNIWLTYGQFKYHSTGKRGFCCPIPQKIVEHNSFRQFSHIPSHLRTFYAGLFKKIKKEDLLYNNEFFKMSCDIAAMFPMIEMASKGHFTFIPQVLLEYNNINDLSHHKVSKTLQRKLDLEIRKRKKYSPLEKLFEPVPKNPEGEIAKIGLLIVATGKYIAFANALIESAEKYFCPKYDVTYFVFTDGEPLPLDNVVKIEQKKLGWPYDTMMRYEMYYNAKDLLEKMDYLFACDADMLFVNMVSDEIFSDRVATQHPGFVNKKGTYETRKQSTAYVAPNEAQYYFAGGLNGGKTEIFLQMAKDLTRNIYKDLENNIIALWHEESHLNRYYIDNKPTLMLSPSYCYPENWSLPYKKRLLALDKNHKEARS